MMSGESFCVIVPAFNEAKRIGDVVRQCRAHAQQVVVIDDGSTDGTGDVASTAGAHVIRHERNLGKGASLVTGFDYARKQGFDLVITIDADGQHDPAQIPRFLATYHRTKIPVLIGNRLWNRKQIPLVRRWTNQTMSWLLSKLMKRYLPDTQCGFRLFRTDLLSYVPSESPRFAMESEILLHTAARHFRMDSVRIPVLYRGQESRIHPVVDSFRFFAMLFRYYNEQRMKRA
jgi:glycosyltransferase involved in cell wall biosynthesis